jgi:hypothetical protein
MQVVSRPSVASIAPFGTIPGFQTCKPATQPEDDTRSGYPEQWTETMPVKRYTMVSTRGTSTIVLVQEAEPEEQCCGIGSWAGRIDVWYLRVRCVSEFKLRSTLGNPNMHSKLFCSKWASKGLYRSGVVINSCGLFIHGPCMTTTTTAKSSCRSKHSKSTAS